MATTAHTLSRAQISPLSEQEIAAWGCNTKFTVKYTDCNTGTTATDVEVVTLGALPAFYAVDKAIVNITTAFAGTTAFTLTVGTTTSANAFVTSQSVLTAGTLAGALASDAISTATATKNITATFTNATGGSPSALTAGQLDIYLNILNTAAVQAP